MLQKVIACFCLCFFCYGVWAQEGETVGLGKVQCSFSLDKDGRPVYAVSFGGKPVVLPSRMGFVLAEDSTFYKGFSLVGVERRAVDTVWQPVWGDVQRIRDHYAELTVHLRKSGSGGLLDIIFRVYPGSLCGADCTSPGIGGGRQVGGYHFPGF